MTSADLDQADKMGEHHVNDWCPCHDKLAAALSERDGYRATAERRWALRDELEQLLGVGDTFGEEQFAAAVARVRELLAAEARCAELRGAMDADDRRLREAAIRVWGEHTRGCDTPDEMAELILPLRAERDRLRAEVSLVADQVIEWSKRASRYESALREITGDALTWEDADKIARKALGGEK